MTALLHPRFLQSVALPDPTEREADSMVFQRKNIVHLCPQQGEDGCVDRMVPRAGVRARHGLAQNEYEESCGRVRSSSKCSSTRGSSWSIMACPFSGRGSKR